SSSAKRTTSVDASSASPLPLQHCEPQVGQSYLSARSGKVKNTPRARAYFFAAAGAPVGAGAGVAAVTAGAAPCIASGGRSRTSGQFPGGGGLGTLNRFC